VSTSPADAIEVQVRTTAMPQQNLFITFKISSRIQHKIEIKYALTIQLSLLFSLLSPKQIKSRFSGLKVAPRIKMIVLEKKPIIQL
jgi:hypothetical protein